MPEEGPWPGAHSQWKAGQGQVQCRIGVPAEVLRELVMVIKTFPSDDSARAGRWVPARTIASVRSHKPCELLREQ